MPSLYFLPYEEDRSLDDVGPLAVLGAMVEQRKRTPSVPPPPRCPDDRGDAPGHDAFQKIR